MALANEKNAVSGAKTPILITYFSWSGNTREIANEIRRQIGGDLFEINALNPYPTDYNECVTQAKKELDSSARPPLVAKVTDIASYDTVFIGYPNWWDTMPTPLFTFLETHDLSGKTVAPFCTHGGGEFGRSVKDLKKLCANAVFVKGIAINDSLVKRSKENITGWLNDIASV
ncbi:MAG: hypothetical protein LBO72_09860 [Helicobacteraceae bacterium]|nr:hypothetical protein [Helicobacteraceae bacterium]